MQTLEQMRERLANLLEIRGGGVRRITYEGQTVEYEAGPDLDRAIADLNRQIAEAERGRRRVRRVHAVKDL